MPKIEYKQYDKMPGLDDPGLCHRYRPDDWPDDEEYHEVFEIPGKGWFAVMETGNGGCTRTSSKATKEEAEAAIYEHIAFIRAFWDQKVAWMNNGDKTTPDRHDKVERQVIRLNGMHYVVGQEPSEAERRGNRGGLGHGGREWHLKLKATGEVIVTHNLWCQGTIDPEYIDLLTDNAEDVTPVPQRSAPLGFLGG